VPKHHAMKTYQMFNSAPTFTHVLGERRYSSMHS